MGLRHHYVQIELGLPGVQGLPIQLLSIQHGTIQQLCLIHKGDIGYQTIFLCQLSKGNAVMAHGLIEVLLDFPQELRYLHVLMDGKMYWQGLDKHTGCIRQPLVMASVVDRAEEALILIQRLGQGIAKGT